MATMTMTDTVKLYVPYNGIRTMPLSRLQHDLAEQGWLLLRECEPLPNGKVLVPEEQWAKPPYHHIYGPDDVEGLAERINAALNEAFVLELTPRIAAQKVARLVCGGDE